MVYKTDIERYTKKVQSFNRRKNKVIDRIYCRLCIAGIYNKRPHICKGYVSGYKAYKAHWDKFHARIDDRPVPSDFY